MCLVSLIYIIMAEEDVVSVDQLDCYLCTRAIISITNSCIYFFEMLKITITFIFTAAKTEEWRNSFSISTKWKMETDPEMFFNPFLLRI